MMDSSICYHLQPRMDQYFNQMEKIIKERKTTSRIRFMLQDVIDLRWVNYTHVCMHSLANCSYLAAGTKPITVQYI